MTIGIRVRIAIGIAFPRWIPPHPSGESDRDRDVEYAPLSPEDRVDAARDKVALQTSYQANVQADR